ncbi:MAG TPA: hypothetical protein PK327_11865, partial [Niabella sp.]|nr:hypothetical protein [Niabella sp.]
MQRRYSKILYKLIAGIVPGYLAIALTSTSVLAQSKKVKEVFTVPANKAYAEPFVEGRRPGVSIPVGYPETIGEVSRWQDAGRTVVWYL